MTVDHQAFQPDHYINRELSWLEFNARVLEEAQDSTTPLLERLKFLSIFSSNLDEFFMVRVAGLREQSFYSEAAQDHNADGLKAISQLRLIWARTQQLVVDQYQCLTDHVLPELAEQGISILPLRNVKDTTHLDRFFHEMVYPIITPMAIDPSHPRPRYHNRSLYIGVTVRRRVGIGPKRMFGVVQVPQVLPRLVRVDPESTSYVFLEDLVTARLPELFGGYEVLTYAPFRITRDSDLDVIEQESDDMLRLIEERLKERRRADAVRLEIAQDAADEVVETIVDQEELRDGAAYSEVYRIPGPLDLTGLMGLYDLPDCEALRDKPFTPRLAPGLRRQNEDIFSAISRRDVLMHHPFDDFTPVVDFVQKAAHDPHVLAIKQTLYRTSGDSPIVKALTEAAERGKHVTALVELQARFDEAANVNWARKLEEAGVHVVYGFLDLKTHCKVSMVVRQENETVRRYVHLGTGNYNPSTARVYTDLGLFTANPDFGADVSALFNLLTGYSQGYSWRKLVVAPTDLHNRTIELINEQAELARRGKPSRIFAKLNSLVDHTVIDSLYRASQAGVPIQLLVRGICGLRPDIPGVSENIEVTSIVDRFLEHSRIYVFGPDETAKVFLASADWMPRNFFRRVEVMFPVESPPLRKQILNELIPVYLSDTVRSRRLLSDGTYERVRPIRGATPVRCQVQLLAQDAPTLSPTQLKSALGGRFVGESSPNDRRQKQKKDRANAKKKATSKEIVRKATHRVTEVDTNGQHDAKSAAPPSTSLSTGGGAKEKPRAKDKKVSREKKNTEKLPKEKKRKDKPAKSQRKQKQRKRGK
ncbi:MAG: polyphosphate kinase 1 [Planctomycetales bacterium]|nr:polyphosphate kinase 1 [Planctomycetales bacterium]